MKAIVIHRPQEISLQEVSPNPERKENEVLIKGPRNGDLRIGYRRI